MAVRRGWVERGSVDMAPEGSPLGGRGPGGRDPGGNLLGGRGPEGNPLGGRNWGPGDTLAGRRGKAGTGLVGKGPQGKEPWGAGAPQDIQGWGEDSCPQTPRNSSHEAWPQVLWLPLEERERTVSLGRLVPRILGRPHLLPNWKTGRTRDLCLWAVPNPTHRGPGPGRVGSSWAWACRPEAAPDQSRGRDGCPPGALAAVFLAATEGLLPTREPGRVRPELGVCPAAPPHRCP